MSSLICLQVYFYATVLKVWERVELYNLVVLFVQANV